MTTQSKSRLQGDQKGIVAIIVAVFLMMIISLMVLAMSENSTREQRQAVDRQLSDQAFYNAESGINDTANWLYKNASTAPSIKDDCGPLPTGAPSNILDADGVNRYTCIQYSLAPLSIQYDSVSITTPKVLPIEPVNDAGAPVKLKDLTVSWDDASNREANPDCGFTSGSPPLPANCTYGGVRFELIAPEINRTAIQESGLIAYLLPSPNNSVPGLSVRAPLVYPENQGIIDTAACTGPVGKRRCSKTITDINRTAAFYLSLRSLYQPVHLTIEGVGETNQPVRFKNSQIVIDATGRASDVLRRVQVRIPANNQIAYPGFALQSKDSICKIITVTEVGGVANANTDDATECPIN